MHGELGALAHGTGDQTKAEQGAGQGSDQTLVGRVGRPYIEIVELKRTGPGRQGHHTHEQQHVTDPLGQKRIAGRGHHQGLGIPETHQQVGGEGEHLQQEIAQKQIAAEHHPAHGPLKETDEGIEPCQRPLLIEVSERIDLTDQAHGRHQLEGCQVGQRQVKAQAQVKIGSLEPGKVKVLGPDRKDITDHQRAVDHGQQGHQQVEVGRRPGTVALDPAAGPGQRQHHAAEAIHRDQPGELQR